MITKVLIADLQVEVRELFTRILEKDGSLSCYTSEDARGLFREIEQTSFALVLLDIRMIFPRNFSALKTLHEACPKTTIIVLGYLKEMEIIKKAIKLGAAGYILKPVTARDLRNAIRRHLDTGARLNEKDSTQNSKNEEVLTMDELRFPEKGAG
ncbi:MAG: response regulator [Pseudomonadota bacterium]